MAPSNSTLSGTTCYLSVTFYDKNGSPAAPSSATYEVIDRDTRQQIKPPTAINPISDTVEVTLPPSVNTMINNAKPQETRVVIIRATYGVDDAVNSTFSYPLQNIDYIQ